MTPIDIDAIEREVAAGYVSRVSVGDGRVLYNYTPHAQFDRYWPDAVVLCRGLIVDESGAIVARPFRKFFNVQEHELEAMPSLPDAPAQVTEKFDGSLGIIHHYGGEWLVATRGSLSSEQSVEGAAMLRDAPFRSELRPGVTYLAEIIYPGNRVVVNYNRTRRLVFLAAVDNATGAFVDDVPRSWEDRVTSYTATIAEARAKLAEWEGGNAEGVVLTWPCGTMAKLKTETYVAAHRVATGLSERWLWKTTAQKGVAHVLELLALLPDELHDDAKAMLTALQVQAADVCRVHAEALDMAALRAVTRKEAAKEIVGTAKARGLSLTILFSLLDEKDEDELMKLAWKLIEPPAG